MEKPYESPQSTDPPVMTQSQFGKLKRARFIYVVAVVLVGSLLLTLLVAPRFSMSLDAATLFFASVASGPFAAMHHTSWIFKSSEIIVCIMVFAATFLYIAIPNKVTFVISIFGAIAWVLLGAFLIMLLA